MFIAFWKNRTFYSCICATTSLVIISFIWVILTIVFETATPSNLVAHKMLIFGSETIPLETDVPHQQWLQSIDVHFEKSDCSGQVIVIGSKCSSLPTRESFIPYIDNPEFIYALRGSEFNITVPDTEDIRTDPPNLWFTHTLEAYQSLNEQLSPGGFHEFSCNGPLPQGFSCFQSEPYIGSSLIFNTTDPGYYSFILTNSQDNEVVPVHGIEWSYHNITYDFNVILYTSNYSFIQPRILVHGTKTSTVKLSHFFNFNTPSCALLNFNCRTGSQDRSSFTYNVMISNLIHRADIVVLILLLYIFISFLIVGLMTLYYCKVCKKISVCFSGHGYLSINN